MVVSTDSSDIYSLFQHGKLRDSLRGTPFADALSETNLARRVNRGVRSNLDFLPDDIPLALRQELAGVLEACWSADRRARPPAVECYRRLHALYGRYVQQLIPGGVTMSHGGKARDHIIVEFSNCFQMKQNSGFALS